MNVETEDNWRAWLLLAVALAIHVWDEDLSGFLPFYNGLVMELRSRLGFFPMPTFTHPVWIGGLAIGVVALLLMVPLVERGGRAMRWLAGFLAVVMMLNGLGHLGGSLYFGQWLPGSASAPLLLISAAWLLQRVRRGRWENAV